MIPNKNLSETKLKKFGITMGWAFCVISLLILIRHRHSPTPTIVVAAAFFITGFIRPVLLKPVYAIWMKLAVLLGWINTRLILTVVFYAIFTPIALILKLFRNDLLDIKIEKSRQTYWRKKEDIGTNYERQF